MIRYRTRDLTRLLPGTARPFRRIEKITGRDDDMIILRGVNMFPSQIEEIILGIPGLMANYQLQLKKKGRMDTLDVLVEAREIASGEHDRETLAKQVKGRIKDVIGVSVVVKVLTPNSLPRSEGKAKRLLDLRDK